MFHEPMRNENKQGLIETLQHQQHTIIHPRMAWMLYYEQRKSVRKVCEKFGVSRKTFYKWWNRYQASGCDPESLKDESRKPHRSPNATPAEVVARIVEAKEHTGYGQRRLKYYLADRHDISLSEHTIWKLLKRHYADDRFSVNQSNGASPPRLVGANKEYPGDIVQMSFMEISSYISTSRVVDNHKPYVQYTAIDVTTRLRIVKIYPAKRDCAQSAADFLKFIIEKFPFLIKEIQTPDDRAFTNGSPTMGAAAILFEPFRVLLSRHKIKHTILKAEQMKSSVAVHYEKIDREEFFNGKQYKKPEELIAKAQQFLLFYNNHKKCNELKGLTPLQKVRSFLEFRHLGYFDPFAVNE